MMKYNAKTISEICYKVSPKAIIEYNTPNSNVYLPKLISLVIEKLWIDQIPLSFEEEMLLRKAAKELQSHGYMTFDTD